ncbi:MAG: lipoprotein [Pseudomonadales bacterium]|jgi:predicted small lipoprotein YifL
MILCLLATLVATCGQKGPLYLPEKPKAQALCAFTSLKE